jgi:hypothetical protein
LVELSRQCPTCRADLDLLVQYVQGLQSSLYRAQELTRMGELGPAVWVYLEVLEVDPDNPVARKQVGQVATAVRQFDRTAPGRRWAQGLPPVAKHGVPPLLVWMRRAVVALLVLVAFVVGFMCASSMYSNGSSQQSDKLTPNKAQPVQSGKPENQLGPDN